jgi:hypothetical protein
MGSQSDCRSKSFAKSVTTSEMSLHRDGFGDPPKVIFKATKRIPSMHVHAFTVVDACKWIRLKEDLKLPFVM